MSRHDQEDTRNDLDLTKDDDHMRPVADAGSQDHRAIDVPLATVPGSQHRSHTVNQVGMTGAYRQAALASC
jgi:hypothetical protein